MGLETLLILVGITCKWVLNPGAIQNQQAIGSWCLAIGITLLVAELLFVAFVWAFGVRR